MIVAIAGVGGVGKTTLAKILSKKLGWRLIRPNELAKKKKLYLGYDKKRKSWIVDLQKLKKEMGKIERREKNLVVESLYAHFFRADVVAVLRCKPSVLERRLKKKYDWPTKIAENREAEVMGIITQEAVEIHGAKKVFEFDTTRTPAEKTARQMVQVIRRKGGWRNYRVGRVDWLKDAAD